jgi:hypothetical protein
VKKIRERNLLDEISRTEAKKNAMKAFRLVVKKKITERRDRWI